MYLYAIQYLLIFLKMLILNVSLGAVFSFLDVGTLLDLEIVKKTIGTYF